ncbi:MAG: hypothetical protein QHJ82_13685 [Verrucomicrobiota bacterium]|nr:hypothetical protein [Verrucomicrobiota bacterium]
MNVKGTLILLASVTGLLLCSSSGCKSRTEIETGQVEHSFQNAADVERSLIQQALSEIRTKNYPSALESLNKLAQSPRLTPAQQESLRDLVLQVEEKLRESGTSQTGVNPGISPTNAPGAPVRPIR